MARDRPLETALHEETMHFGAPAPDVPVVVPAASRGRLRACRRRRDHFPPPSSSQAFDMAASAAAIGSVDRVLPLEPIAPTLVALVNALAGQLPSR